MHSCVFNSNVVCHWIILSQNFARLICCSCVSATLKNGRVRYAFAAWISQLENKLPSIEYRGQTDHVIITATLLNGDFDFKSPASYRHDQCTRKKSRSRVSWCRRESGNIQTDGHDRSHYVAVWRGRKKIRKCAVAASCPSVTFTPTCRMESWKSLKSFPVPPPRLGGWVGSRVAWKSLK